MNRWNLLSLVVGLGLIVGLLWHTGVDEVISTLKLVGFGILLVAATHAVTLTLETLAWRSLITPHERVRFLPLLWMRWVGYGTNSLLPVAHIGGEIVRVRLLTREGVSMAVAGASVILDATVTLGSLVIFAALGAALIIGRGAATSVSTPMLIVTGVLLLMCIGFVGAQLSGLLRKLSKRGTHDATLDSIVRAAYRHPGGVFRATGWRLLGWLTGSVEILVALKLLGDTAHLLDAVVLESAGQAMRNAAFVVPAGLGVQEGGIVLVGEVAGVTAAAALGIAFVKRLRDLLLGIPALISWQVAEGRHRARSTPA